MPETSYDRPSDSLREVGSSPCSADGKEYLCEVLGKAKREKGQSPVAVGDVVDFVPVRQTAPAGSKVHHERITKFSRPRVGEELKGTEQIIVANVDQMVIVVSVRQPELKLHLVDRFMVTASKGGLKPVVVINKIDLQHKHDLASYQKHLRVGGDAGRPGVVCRMAEASMNLRELLRNHESILVGHSGTGKSSLLNRLQPGLALKTSEVSESTAKGIHTTTSVELFALDFGGYVVDSPGLKVLGIWDLDIGRGADLFSGIREVLGTL